MRLIVYSHDAFGLGNIRRMLAICQHLLANIPEISILVLSGSPAIHYFKIPARLDYIKLPCLGRDRYGKLAARYLTSDITETIKLRSNLIKTAAIDFQPNLILVDKKPQGLLGELTPILDLLITGSRQTKLVLLLRDILDSPQATIAEWQKQGYYQVVKDYYERILVVGMSEVFDLTAGYQFPPNLANKTVFCGYIKKSLSPISVASTRSQLNLKSGEKLIVVTPGGGEDGYSLIATYLAARSQIDLDNQIKTLIVFGSEMPAAEKNKLSQIIQHHSNVITFDFTECLIDYLQVAHLVVSMGGYNTITEILSVNKKAVVVPRCQPSQEQLIRATKMAELGLIEMVLPQELTAKNLAKAIVKQLNNNSLSSFALNFAGLLNIQREIVDLLPGNRNINSFADREEIIFYPLAI